MTEQRTEWRDDDAVETRRVPVTEARTTRDEDGNPQEIVTNVAVFDKLSHDLGGFVERVEPGALRPAEDVTSEFNHDPNQVLGRTSAGNLDIEETDDALQFRVSPLPDTSYARDVAEAIDAGLVPDGSFTFRVHDEEWEERDEEPDLRTIKDAVFFEGGPVTHGAYPDTQTELNDLSVAERRHQQFREQVEEAEQEVEEAESEDERERMRMRLRTEEVAL